MTRTRAVLAGALGALIAHPAAAVTHLKRGSIPPPIALADLDGREVRTEDLAGQTVVLLFGELYHPKTLAACADIQAALADDRLAGRPITLLLVVAQDAPDDGLRTMAAQAGIPSWRIVHDRDRRAYAAYRVAVLPSLVVLDGSGRVVHAMAGYLQRFADIATDAMLTAEGLLSPQQFELSVHPTEADQVSEANTRAARITSLGRQLMRRGLPEVAEEKFVEAVELAPGYAPARLNLATLQLRRGRLAEAQLQFDAVLVSEPGSIDARLGLAYVGALRGGAELTEAETTLRAVLAGRPDEPRAHYLMGLVHEQREELQEAATSFKTAAELLMARRGTWEMLGNQETIHEP